MENEGFLTRSFKNQRKINSFSMSTLEGNVLFTFSHRTSTKRIFSIQFVSFYIASFSGLWFHAFPHTPPPQGGGGTVLPACCFHMGGAGLKNKWKNKQFFNVDSPRRFLCSCFGLLLVISILFTLLHLPGFGLRFPSHRTTTTGGAGRLSTHVTIV